MTRHIHFVTGRLAEASLREVVEQLAPVVGFEYSIDVMPITVAALLTPQWIAPRLKIPSEATEVLLPGYCGPDLEPLLRTTTLPIHLGPKELRALPEFFGQRAMEHEDAYSIEIIAEINHAPRLERQQILQTAESYRDRGADVIDVGCDPGYVWSGIGDCVAMLRSEGFRVSVDSLQAEEISKGVARGAELVLSVNSSNRQAAPDWGCEVVAIPDQPGSEKELDETLEFLDAHRVAYRVDPILEPIGCGFAASLGRYQAIRRKYPDAAMMMGIGNLTELTDVDSAGVNVLLLGICEELEIRSLLTTEVINWARSSVRECDVARRLVHYAVRHSVPPKRLDSRLVMLRDGKLYPQGEETLRRLATSLKDHNYRIFAEHGKLYLIAAGMLLESEDPFDLFRQLQELNPSNLDLSHAYYLGYELAKATTALTLGKQYNQDQPLDWGFLTRPE